MTRRLARLSKLCATAFVISTTHPVLALECTVHIVGVPDFDQVRLGLEPNNGHSSCFPTSGANWLAYIANHGCPDVMSGPRNWQLQENHGFVTNDVQILAELMEVNGKGTGGDHYRSTMQLWLDNFAPSNFTVQSIGSKNTFAPGPEHFYARLAVGLAPGPHLWRILSKVIYEWHADAATSFR